MNTFLIYNIFMYNAFIFLLVNSVYVNIFIFNLKLLLQISHLKSSRGSAIPTPRLIRSFTPYSTRSSVKRLRKYSRPNILLVADIRQ